MRTYVYLCAVHSLGLAIFHIGFWKIFHWRKELARASVSTRAIIQIANLRLIYFFLFVAFLCSSFPHEMVSTQLGRAFMAGMSLFWIGRLIEQFIFLPFNKPLIHILSAVFAMGALLFAWPLIQS